MKNDATTGAAAPVTNKTAAKPTAAPAKPEQAEKAEATAKKMADKPSPASQKSAPAAPDQGAAGGAATTASKGSPTAPKAEPASGKAEPAKSAAVAAASTARKAETSKPSSPTKPVKPAGAKPAVAAAAVTAKPLADDKSEKADPRPSPKPAAQTLAQSAPAKPVPAKPVPLRPDAPAARESSAKPSAAPLSAMVEKSADVVRSVAAQAKQSSETMRQATTERAVAAGGGLAEINTKMLELVRAQTEAALDLWRAALSARSPAEALQAQMSAMQKAYQDTTRCWKDLFEASARAAGTAFKPGQGKDQR